MQISFEGKYAVITGAASGLGANVAGLLRDAGATVVGFDVAPVVQPGITGLKADIGNPSSIDAAVSQLERPVDVLCNIAGLPQTKPVVDVLRVNFLGLRHLTESLAPSMAPGATVTNVSSNAGNGWPQRQPLLEEALVTPDFESGLRWVEGNAEAQGDPYMLSKELVQLYTIRRSHGLYRDHGVRMNSVSPGVMETPMMAEFRKANTDAVLDGIAGANTLGRMAPPEEVAPAVVFLASSLAGFCSGTIFDVDGGWTAVTRTDQVDYSVFG